jgi:sensor domain CHASE-containing protein
MQFKQLEEVATEKDKEYIQNSIKFVQEQLEK